MPETPLTCPLDCPDACGMVAETDAAGRLLRLRGEREHGWSRGALCRKTASWAERFDGPERLRTPLVREGGELVPATWDAALARIRARVAPLRGRGERVLAAWYAGTMGRVQRGFPLRAMHALGATLVDGGICDSATTAGYEAVLGAVRGPDLEAAAEADLILLWGCDARRTVQHLQPALAALCRRGDPVLALDVYRTETVAALERWGGAGLVLRPGTDAALALGLCRLAYERGGADRAFLEGCVGAARFEAHVRAGHDLAWTAAVTGLAPRAVEELYERLAAARRPLIKTGVGFGRRRNGGMSMRAVASLAAVLGRADRLHYQSSDCVTLADDVVQRPDLRPPGAPARVVPHVQLGRELESGRYEALFVWGHNPAVVCPEADRVRAALEREDLFVVVHEIVLTETAARADVVLPATLFAEHPDVYKSYGHRRVRRTPRAVTPPPGPRCNVEAFAAIARALELPRETWDVDAEALCDALLAASAPALGADVVARVAAGEAARVDPPPGLGAGTPSGRVELWSAALEAAGGPPMATFVPDDACGEQGAFWLVSAPSVHTHNSTFSHSPRHLARRGPHRAFLAPADAARLGVSEGDWVTLSNRRGALSFPAAVSADMPPGLVRVDGLPRAVDVPEGRGINALVPAELSDLGDGNVLYSTRVDVSRRRQPPAGHA